MPFNKAGKFKMNHQLASASDKQGQAQPPSSPEMPAQPSDHDGDEQTTLKIHPDGSASTHGSDGSEDQHESPAHGILHMAEKHGAKDQLMQMLQQHSEPKQQSEHMPMPAHHSSLAGM